MNSIRDFFNVWSSAVFEKYNIDPTVFILIYCITFIPAWVVVALVAKKLLLLKSGGNPSILKRQIYTLIVFEAFILLLPYAYLVAFVDVDPILRIFTAGLLGMMGFLLVRRHGARIKYE